MQSSGVQMGGGSGPGHPPDRGIQIDSATFFARQHIFTRNPWKWSIWASTSNKGIEIVSATFFMLVVNTEAQGASNLLWPWASTTLWHATDIIRKKTPQAN